MSTLPPVTVQPVMAVEGAAKLESVPESTGTSNDPLVRKLTARAGRVMARIAKRINVAERLISVSPFRPSVSGQQYSHGHAPPQKFAAVPSSAPPSATM